MHINLPRFNRNSVIEEQQRPLEEEKGKFQEHKENQLRVQRLIHTQEEEKEQQQSLQKSNTSIVWKQKNHQGRVWKEK